MGLILYEMLHTKDRSTRKEGIRFALIMIAISLAALLTYNLIEAYLSNAYISGGYLDLPTSLRVLNINTRELNGLVGFVKGTSRPYSMLNPFYVTSSLMIVFLGFGVASLLDPIASIVLTSPWLVEVFVFGRSRFTLTWDQYFSFALGGVIVATVLSMRHYLNHKNQAFFRSMFTVTIVVFVLILSILEPNFIISKNTNSISQSFLFQVNSTQEKYYSELNYVMNKIPPNASLVAPFFTMPQLCGRKTFDTIPSTSSDMNQLWFAPQYILTDFNENISLNAYAPNQYQNFMRLVSRGYILYAKNGTAELYKLD